MDVKEERMDGWLVAEQRWKRVNASIKEPCVFKVKPTRKIARVLPMKKL